MGYTPGSPVALQSSGVITATRNWVGVIVASGSNLKFITVSPWAIGSKVYLSLNIGITITNNASSPPAGTASILLATASGSKGPTTNGNSLLILYYDGTNWREEGVF